MRTVRYALALGCLAGAAGQAGAQSSDLFRDSWFWGAKASLTSVSTPEQSRSAEPGFGTDWLITRTIGGLYLSADFAFFDAVGSVDDASTSSGRRAVAVKNMRRFGFAGMVFPRTFGPVRPYAGLGLTINVIGSAEGVVEEGDPPVEAGVAQRIEDGRSRSAVQGILGAQGNLGNVAVFAQVTLTPGSRRFLLSENSMQFFEAGVRYRVGRAREDFGRTR